MEYVKLLNKYLEEHILSLDEVKENIENLLEHRSNLSYIIGNLKREDFDLIDMEELKMILIFVSTKKYDINHFEKTKEAISIIKEAKKLGLSNLKQIDDAKTYLKFILDILKRKDEILKEKIDMLSDKYKQEFANYNKYHNYVSSEEAFKKLDMDSLLDLINFLSEVKMNSEDAFAITRFLCKYAINKCETSKNNRLSKKESMFTDSENEQIKYLLGDIKKESDIYLKLDDNDINIIKSIVTCIKNGNVNYAMEIGGKAKYEHILYLMLLREFQNEYNVYLEIDEGLLDDNEYDKYRKEQALVVKNLLIKIKKITSSFETTKDKEENNLENQSLKREKNLQNLVIFLEDKNLEQAFVLEDATILKTFDPNGGNYLKEFLEEIYYREIYKYLSVCNNKNIKPSTNIKDYSKDLRPYRIRRGSIRIAYSKLPVSCKVKEALKKKYNLPDTLGVILIYGVKYKKKDTYDEFNRRIANCIKEITWIRTLFDNNSEDINYDLIYNLVDNGLSVSEYVIKEYGKKGGRNV